MTSVVFLDVKGQFSDRSFLRDLPLKLCVFDHHYPLQSGGLLFHLNMTTLDLVGGLRAEFPLLGVVRRLASRGLVPWHCCHGLLPLHHVCLRFIQQMNFVNQVGENHFCSGYSWLAEQVDLTGSRGGVVFLGANFGWLIFPPIGLQITLGPTFLNPPLSWGCALLWPLERRSLPSQLRFTSNFTIFCSARKLVSSPIFRFN